jgi:O-acetyl-ADP-ribose deacetylase (regulator of RNase III)
MVVRIGQTAIETQKGDISQAQVEAIVNAANNHLWMGGGVAGALKRAGGIEIEAEAMAKGPVEIGAAVVTSAGSLPAKYVIHAAVMGQDLQTNRSNISKATRNSLIQARDLKVGSIAFPALGTGVGGFPADDAADAMISECVSFVQGGSATLLRKILFVLFSDDLLRAFEERLHAGN